MIVSPIHTRIFNPGESLFRFITEHISSLQEFSVLAVTSKIVSLAEAQIVDNQNKQQCIINESDWYIDASQHSYGVTLTIRDGILIANAGIDESNGNGHMILWPKNPFLTAQTIWSQLKQHYKIQKLGIILTDSRITPLRWGTIGVSIAYCGFEPLKNYIQTPDIFQRPLTVTKASHQDGLASSAVMVMGEGNEQTPLALLTDIPFIAFSSQPPTKEERNQLIIERENDLFSSLLSSSLWKRGNHTEKEESVIS